MSMPVMKLSPQIVALRIRENEWDALERDLDDLVLNRNYPLDIPKILGCIQASLTNRQGFLSIEDDEHKDIQKDVDALDVLIHHINYRNEK